MKHTLRYFYLFLILLTSAFTQAQQISSLGNGIKSIYVLDLLHRPDSNELYACGYFQNVVGDPSQHILKWKNNQWQTVGGGLTNPDQFDFASAMIWYKGQLVLGGGFDQVGGNPASRVATWNGQSWSQLGNGLRQPVSCFAVFRDTLYASCTRSANGAQVACVYKLNGNQWDSLESLTMPNLTLSLAGVRTLYVFNDRLLAGGGFVKAGNITANNIAAWDGSQWTAMDAGTNGEVRAMETYKGQLYIGGRFTTAGSQPADYLARWNGSTWEGVVTQLAGGVYCLENYQGYLAIGGEFGAQGMPQFLTLFDGSQHYGQLDADNVINRLLTVGNTLYVAGNMDELGGKNCSKVAAVNFPYLAAPEPEHQSFAVYPNPGKGLIHWEGKASVKVFNMLGTEVFTSATPAESADLGGLPAGFYILQLQKDNGSVHTIRIGLQR